MKWFFGLLVISMFFVGASATEACFFGYTGCAGFQPSFINANWQTPYYGYSNYYAYPSYGYGYGGFGSVSVYTPYGGGSVSFPTRRASTRCYTSCYNNSYYYGW